MSIFVILQINELQWNNSREKKNHNKNYLPSKIISIRICCRWWISISEIEIWNTFTFSVLYRCGCCARVVSNAFRFFSVFPIFAWFSIPHRKKSIRVNGLSLAFQFQLNFVGCFVSMHLHLTLTHTQIYYYWCFQLDFPSSPSSSSSSFCFILFSFGWPNKPNACI